MWGGTDEAESIVTIWSAFEHSINIVDTAPVYGFGRSEEIVGEAIAEGRLQPKPDCNGMVARSRNASRARILQEVEDSLRRVRTDYIDIYRVHWLDPLVIVEETAEAMLALLEQGKIRAIGVSNVSVLQMERFRRVAPLHVLQPPYNPFERGIEADLLPYCRKTRSRCEGKAHCTGGCCPGGCTPRRSSTATI
jgi:aryl-alcohol dehydrogenase-like predicted oxidoreductase